MAKATYTTYSGIIRRNNRRRVLEKASRGPNPKYACTSYLSYHLITTNQMDVKPKTGFLEANP